jgi:uncharacterized protein (DUF1501 family)
MQDMTHTRRQFMLASGAMAAVVPTATAFGLQLAAVGSAASQSATGYKALVCIYLAGGNDGHNTIMATDSDSWGRYFKARTSGVAPIAIMPPGTGRAALGSASKINGQPIDPFSTEAWGGALPFATRTPQAIPAGTNARARTFAMHPMMAPLMPLYQQGRLAVVANVGTLIQPLTKAEFHARSRPVPANLFSHNDQASMWQAGRVEGARVGWGGAFGDLLASGNGSNAVFTAMSTAGNTVLLAGRNVVQYQMSTGATPALAIRPAIQTSMGGATAAMLNQMIRDTSTDTLMGKDIATMVDRSMDSAGLLNAAAAGPLPRSIPKQRAYRNPMTGAPSSNPLEAQLLAVARMIAAGPGLGLKRQVFFVRLDGFDNHNNQNFHQPDQLSKLAHGLAAFDAALSNVGGVDMRGSVTAFTASDFGRTFSVNGDGTDHAWGSHHLVWGGAVRGGDMFGQYPTLGIDGPGFENPNMWRNMLIPTTSVDQYAATLGAWMGVSNADLNLIFPNLRNFARPTLGFV